MLLKGGIVHQYVQPAQLACGVLDGTAAEFGIGYIAGDKECSLTFSLHRAPSLFGIFMLAQVDDGNVGSFSSKQDRHCPADAGVSPGNQGHLARQFLRAEVFWSLVLRPGLQLTLPAWLLEVLLGKGRLRVAPGAAGLHCALLLGVARLSLPPGLRLTLQLPVGLGSGLSGGLTALFLVALPPSALLLDCHDVLLIDDEWRAGLVADDCLLFNFGM